MKARVGNFARVGNIKTRFFVARGVDQGWALGWVFLGLSTQTQNPGFWAGFWVENFRLWVLGWVLGSVLGLGTQPNPEYFSEGINIAFIFQIVRYLLIEKKLK